MMTEGARAGDEIIKYSFDSSFIRRYECQPLMNEGIADYKRTKHYRTEPAAPDLPKTTILHPFAISRAFLLGVGDACHRGEEHIMSVCGPSIHPPIHLAAKCNVMIHEADADGRAANRDDIGQRKRGRPRRTLANAML